MKNKVEEKTAIITQHLGKINTLRSVNLTDSIDPQQIIKGVVQTGS